MSRRESGGASSSSRGRRAKGQSDRGVADKRTDAAPRSKLPPGDKLGNKTGDKSGRELGAGLYLVATPIGNAADITLRALDILAKSSVVACEDTRLTGGLLARHGIAAHLVPYHDHNAERARPALLARMAQGESVALVSDAGTPLVSDPGFKLVRACIESGIPVTAAPGPSAALTALILSGLPSDRFLFAGFLPAKTHGRKETLAELAHIPATLVFYESPNRLADSLADMAEVLGSRPAAVARELTKLYEEVRRAALPELAEHYRQQGAPKGEVVVVVAPPEAQKPPEAQDLDALLIQTLADGHTSVRDAASIVAARTGLPKREVYARALALTKKDKN